jgi:hypothetical protein
MFEIWIYYCILKYRAVCVLAYSEESEFNYPIAFVILLLASSFTLIILCTPFISPKLYGGTSKKPVI